MSRTRDTPNGARFSIRTALTIDAPTIQQIAKASGIDAWTIEQYGREIRSKGAIVLTAVFGNVVVGFINGRIVPGSTSDPDAEIYNIAVADAFRHKGIGRKLLAGAVYRFESNSCRYVWLEVRTSNQKAIQLYENKGFNRIGLRKNFYSKPVEDGLVMRLEIAGESE